MALAVENCDMQLDRMEVKASSVLTSNIAQACLQAEPALTQSLTHLVRAYTSKVSSNQRLSLPYIVSLKISITHQHCYEFSEHTRTHKNRMQAAYQYRGVQRWFMGPNPLKKVHAGQSCLRINCTQKLQSRSWKHACQSNFTPGFVTAQPQLLSVSG